MLDHFVIQAFFSMATASAGSARIAESFDIDDVPPQ
jgi:hypothetical protein